MPSKKTTKKKEKVMKNQVIINALKSKYFELALKENYPKTPELTKELDTLESSIKELLK
jgi:hypothetical protein